MKSNGLPDNQIGLANPRCASLLKPLRKFFLLLWLVPPMAVWLFAVACSSSDESQNPIQQSSTTKLKQDWKLQATRHMQDSRNKKYSPKGGFYLKQVRILESLLNGAPTKVVEAEFQRICAADVGEFSGNDDEMDKNYDNVLMVAFVERSIKSRDAKHLVTLLSHHCPRHVVYIPLEFSLAYDWPGSIERLFDCYSATKSPAAKKDIVFCLRRAFPSLRGRFTVDNEFVEQAHTWYAVNQSRLKVNERYGYLPSQPPASDGEDRTNLFLFKSK